MYSLVGCELLLVFVLFPNNIFKCAKLQRDVSLVASKVGLLVERNLSHYEHNASGHIQRDCDESSAMCSCTVVCALAMLASLEIKALNKATRKHGLCSTKKVLYQCRLARSVEEVLS